MLLGGLCFSLLGYCIGICCFRLLFLLLFGDLGMFVSLGLMTYRGFWGVGLFIIWLMLLYFGFSFRDLLWMVGVYFDVCFRCLLGSFC